VQYGAGVKSVAAYLLGYQLLPYERCAEALNDLFNCQLPSGTLATLLKGCAGELVGAEMLVKVGHRVSAVLGVDETNLRVSRRQDWIHVSSTDKLTLLVHDRRRSPDLLPLTSLPSITRVSRRFTKETHAGRRSRSQLNSRNRTGGV
jgi:transposase